MPTDAAVPDAAVPDAAEHGRHALDQVVQVMREQIGCGMSEAAAADAEQTRGLVALRRVRPPTTIFGHTVRKFAHQADVLRLELLQTFGGVYLDMDVLLLRPLAPLVRVWPIPSNPTCSGLRLGESPRVAKDCGHVCSNHSANASLSARRRRQTWRQLQRQRQCQRRSIFPGSH